MTSKGNNGHRKDVKPNELEVFEPAFAPGDEDSEKIGYFKADIKGDEGEVVDKLPFIVNKRTLNSQRRKLRRLIGVVIRN
ncbi:hypothetical protein NIES4071_42640 [Calothrix sp. NIES-4071]|nr:hypothetical protein NIES4071_42640 [Calothrix sp. NIES-4071]BAZ58577.1 hypothetical protein NIES4105_42560 [Calothrix sp. NIES-4105]